MPSPGQVNGLTERGGFWVAIGFWVVDVDETGLLTGGRRVVVDGAGGGV